MHRYTVRVKGLTHALAHSRALFLTAATANPFCSVHELTLSHTLGAAWPGVNAPTTPTPTPSQSSSHTNTQAPPDAHSAQDARSVPDARHQPPSDATRQHSAPDARNQLPSGTTRQHSATDTRNQPPTDTVMPLRHASQTGSLPESARVASSASSGKPDSTGPAERVFLVAQCLAGGSLAALSAAHSPRFSSRLVPWGAVAADISPLAPPLQGRAFCFLPLPVLTTLPVHVVRRPA